MNIDPMLLEKAKKVTARRPKTVIDHIIKYGFITTEELKNTYGYGHPPRAAGDVRDQGIPLETFKVTGSDGRKIAAYKFGDPSKIEGGKLGGRKVLPKKLKKSLIEKHGSRCAISLEYYDESHLQIDHRVPYRISGDDNTVEKNPDDFMLLCGSAQRQKSWSCEHCDNFLNKKSLLICTGCYWAYPESYTHIATNEERRVDLTFKDGEMQIYEKIKDISILNKTTIQDEIKNLIK